MKYVFFINNHLTFYMALSVQKHLNILEEHCLYVCENGYKHGRLFEESCIRYDRVRRLCSIHLLRVGQLLRMPLILYLINRKFRVKVKQEENFILVVPHFGIVIAQILSNYLNCQSVRVYEEGSVNYAAYPRASLNEFNKRSFGNRLKYGYMEQFLKYFYPLGAFKSIRYPRTLQGDAQYEPFLRTAYFAQLPHKHRANVCLETYSLHKEAFKEDEFRNHVIKFYRDDAHQFAIADGSTVFIFEALIEQNFIPYDVFMNIWRKILLYIPGERISIKFHPKSQAMIRKRIMKDTEVMGRTVEEIPQSVSLEQVFLQRKQLNIYGFKSSLLLYAVFFKAGVVVSFDDFLLYYYPRYQHRVMKYNVEAFRLLMGKYIAFISPTGKLPTG